MAPPWGPGARQTAERSRSAYASSDGRGVVDAPETDAVLVATRHDLHPVVAAAGWAGAAVLAVKASAASVIVSFMP